MSKDIDYDPIRRRIVFGIPLLMVAAAVGGLSCDFPESKDSNVEKTTGILLGLNQNIDEIQAIRGSEKWSKVGTRYFVERENETIEGIADRNQTTPDKIRQLNKPNGLFGKDIFSRGEIFLVPVSPTPTRFFGELFDQTRETLTNLEGIKKSKGATSTEAKTSAAHIEAKWYTAPAKSEPVKAPEIVVDFEVNNIDASRITSEIAELIDPLPKLGRFVKKISVVDWKKSPNGLLFNFDLNDPRAQITIPTRLGHDKEDWTKEIRSRHLAGSIGSLISIYRDDSLVSQFMPKTELIKFLLEYTKIADKRIELFSPNGTAALLEDGEFAWSIASNLTKIDSSSSSPKEDKIRDEISALNEKWLSTLLGKKQ
ncbi:MAG: hypothetical protein WCV81_05980 [Microgenomates group bacterium]|jgi:hypothetical protein